MATNPGSDNVEERKRYDFDLNVKPVDESLDLNVKMVGEENCDSSHNSNLCSICLKPNDRRTTVTLKCDHKFHLDCIGSTFNAKKLIQCPNCKNIEPGQWQFADGNDNVEDSSDDDEDEEENDPGFFTDTIIRSELCPYKHFSHNNVGGQHCLYAECYFLSRQLFPEGQPQRGEVPNHTVLGLIQNSHSSQRILYPLFPYIPRPSNRKIFWSAVRPGVMRARHYVSHPFYNHSPFGNFKTSSVDAPMGVSYESSVTRQLNSNPSILDDLPTEPVSRQQPAPRSSLFASSASNNGNLRWDSEPFLEPAQQNIMDNKFYETIYGI